MNKINFVDTTLRDAHQSLWGVRMSTAMAYQIASSINQSGFKAVDFAAPTHFVFQIRTYRENPWERVRLFAGKIDKAPLSLMMLGNTFTTFRPMRGPIIGLWMERCYANGLRRIQPMEESNNMGNIAETVNYAKEAGLEVVIPLIYSYSPVHTDDYFAKKAREIADLSPDSVYLKDPGGLLTPERVKTLVPCIQKNIDGLPLEIHSHCTTGLAPICYLEAIKLGVRTVHTAIPPLANGSSVPSVTNIIKNLDVLGYESELDQEAIQEVSDHFNFVARREGLPVGRVLEFDAAQYEHQIPGGVISNLTRQLAEIGLKHRLEDVINEVVLIRKELGYPIMVTPLSQYVVTQATLNVTLGERYKELVDEIIKIVLGCYGPQAGAIDKNLLDRVSNLPIAKNYTNWEIPRPSIKEIRRQFGADVSDDELLLRVLCQDQKDIEAMHAAGPIDTYYPPPQKPLVELIEGLINQKKHTYIYLERDNLTIKLGRQSNYGRNSAQK
jgi:oxaloacetate decarboxylase alpha subunit